MRRDGAAFGDVGRAEVAERGQLDDELGHVEVRFNGPDWGAGAAGREADGRPGRQAVTGVLVSAAEVWTALASRSV